MIQRIQSIYLLGAFVISIIMYFIPLGYLPSDLPVRFNVCGMYNQESGALLHTNWLLTIVLSASLLLQIVSIFLFNNRRRQAMLVQISLVLILGFVVLTLLYQDVLSLIGQKTIGNKEIEFTWGIILMGIVWGLNYLALRAIKKDEALVRSADRMR